MSTDDEPPASPPRFGRIPHLQGFLPLSPEAPSPMATHGHGALNTLIRTRSNTSLHNTPRAPSAAWGRDTDDEEALPVGRPRRLSGDDEIDEFRHCDERRLSAVLMGPQMRSQRLIGNSNPRYRWGRYWKTEEQLKTMRKPMYAGQYILLP
jgi:hypothetical protein